VNPLPHPQVQRAVGWKRAPPQQPQPSADGQGEEAATAGLPRSSTAFPEPGGAGPKVRLPLSPGVQGDRVPPSVARLTIFFLLRLPHMVLQRPPCELLPVSQRHPLFFRRRRCSRPPPPLALRSGAAYRSTSELGLLFRSIGLTQHLNSLEPPYRLRGHYSDCVMSD
jgi:hypothetical protein